MKFSRSRIMTSLSAMIAFTTSPMLMRPISRPFSSDRQVADVALGHELHAGLDVSPGLTAVTGLLISSLTGVACEDLPCRITFRA